MIKVPTDTKQIIQTNTSDTLGTLWSTNGIDLTASTGRFRVGQRIIKNISSDDQSNLVCPVAFRHFDSGDGTSGGRIWAVGGTRIFKNTGLPSDTFSQDSTSGTPTTCSSDYSDMEIFNGNLYVSTASEVVYELNSSNTWSHFTAGAGDSTSTHMLCQYANRMYMTKSQSNILSWDTSNTPATLGDEFTLQLGDSESNVITFIRASASRIWIGTLNTTGGKGYIYEWDGSSAEVTKSYRLQSAGVLSCTIKDDIPYVTDIYGSLLAWNGASFQVIARIKPDAKLLKNAMSQKNDRFIHPNGMMVTNGQFINLLLNNELAYNGAPINERIPSGIWEYTDATGFYHTQGIGTSKSGDTITDYLCTRISRAGALQELNIESTNSGRNGTVLLGADFFSDATTVKSGIFYDDQNDTLQKYGYFVTQKIESTQVTDEFLKTFIKYKKLINAADRIAIKYRQGDVDPIEGLVTWTSTTTFTTTLDLSSYAIGDEVEITKGVGAGRCSHITAMSLVTGTYTVTVSEIYTSATGTAFARFQHWKLLSPVISDQATTYKEYGVGNNGNWIQYKVCMLFTNTDEFEQLISQSKPFLNGDVVVPKLLKP